MKIQLLTGKTLLLITKRLKQTLNLINYLRLWLGLDKSQKSHFEVEKIMFGRGCHINFEILLGLFGGIDFLKSCL